MPRSPKNSITPEYREMLCKMYLDGMKHREIAELTGRSYNSVKYITKDAGTRQSARRWLFRRHVKLGHKGLIPDNVLDVLRKELKGSETMITCMCRLIEGMGK